MASNRGSMEEPLNPTTGRFEPTTRFESTARFDTTTARANKDSASGPSASQSVPYAQIQAARREAQAKAAPHKKAQRQSVVSKSKANGLQTLVGLYT